MIDWDPVLVNLTAPGGVGVVLLTGIFAWRKIKNLSPTDEESEEAVAVSTAPKEVKNIDTMTHDLVAMMARCSPIRRRSASATKSVIACWNNSSGSSIASATPTACERCGSPM